MATERETWIDFEFGLKSGALRTISAKEGRDPIIRTEHGLAIEVHHGDALVERLEVARDAIEFQRTIQRVVEPDPDEVLAEKVAAATR